MMKNQLSFISGYDGETDYAWNGKRVSCRHHQANTVKDDYKDECNQRIGAVYFVHSPENNEFPPQELMAHFPGYVRGRYRGNATFRTCHWTSGTFQLENCNWETEQPTRVENHRLGLRAVAWCEEMERHNNDID